MEDVKALGQLSIEKQIKGEEKRLRFDHRKRETPQLFSLFMQR
jgi:hypothetical protein